MLYVELIVALLLASGQTQKSDSHPPCEQLKVTDRIVSWGHRKADHPRKIEAIIVHSSYNALTPDSFSVDGVLREYRQIGVSPHYIIGRDGTIYRLVRDRDIAYHAGKSTLPDGKTDVNSVSIGIEIVNTIHDSPTDAQYASLVLLVRCLESRYDISYVLGHKDIAPGRKTDPWNFDWHKFHKMLK
jgi:N-acetyl-anhydromuramyl-L-alanine amidase AmpD